MPVESVAIIGAGIAGLTAALCFARHGIRSDIIEQTPELTEVGAGLQISPNAARILDTLGVLGDIEDVWTEPLSINLTSGSTLKTLMALPVGDVARQRWHAPYGVLHRATLQKALFASVIANPLCRMHLGKRMDRVDRTTIAQIVAADHDLIVGADGVWSKTRDMIVASPVASFSGDVAWRFMVSETDAPAFLSRNTVTALLGPSGHIVAYPLKEIAGFNIVAIASGANPGSTWKAQSTGEHMDRLLVQFKHWHPSVSALLANAGNASFWPLYQVGDGRWHNGRDTVLIGDAAHAMMPFAAQGAAMAIEDAFELAGQIASRQPLASALVSFETMRLPRIAKARKRASLNKFAYHASGPFRLGRDLIFAARPPQAFVADFDWLYGYRAKG
jgi:salicylate hydroxylase